MAKGRPEIDKEAMFRKIMPSSFSAPGEEEGVPAPAAPHNPLSPPAPVSQLTQPPSPPQAAGSPRQADRRRWWAAGFSSAGRRGPEFW